MPIGLILTEWDSIQGTIIRKTIPKTVSLSPDEINKILMSHSISKKQEPEIIDFRMNHKIILSYCAKDKIVQMGYSMLMILFHEDEDEIIPEFKRKLLIYGQNLFNLSFSERLSYFLEIGYEIFMKKSSRKLLFVGPSAMGKTSIKKIFFESNPPEELLEKPLEPTYGLEYFTLDYLDLDLGIADLAGQEIEEFLSDASTTEIDPFEDSDVVIYVFDPLYWDSNSEDIVNHLEKIQKKLDKYHISTHLYIFCHKIDLVSPDRLESFRKMITESLAGRAENIFFTSITKPYSSELINIMQEILSQISERTKKFSETVQEIMKDTESYGVIVFQNQKILFESTSRDLARIPSTRIKSLIEQIYAIHNSIELPVENFTISSQNFSFLYTTIDDLGKEQIVIVSTELNSEQLGEYAAKICQNLKIV